ncbi:MAG: hypothetical protein EAZ30_04135 [Betaproteobacteria bacterium]|nr:MAG: hypothetical protein EAZ30_04135 [Betaproteobacteria bacterium]
MSERRWPPLRNENRGRSAPFHFQSNPLALVQFEFISEYKSLQPMRRANGTFLSQKLSLCTQYCAYTAPPFNPTG